MADFLSVNDVAQELGVQDRQVRNLIRRGSLVAQRVGRSWVVPASSVASLQRARPSAGRPFGAELAWWLLVSLDVALRPEVSIAMRPADRRLDHRRRKALAALPDAEDLPVRLRRHGVPHRVWFHPAAADRLAADERVARCDPSPLLGLDVSDLAVSFVAATDLDVVVADHHGRVVDEPGRVPGEVRHVAVPDLDEQIDWRHHLLAATLVDLCSHDDARVRHAACERLSQAALAARDRASALP